jgi:putative nucleotidyltransferase with HDIG domain
MNDFEKAFEIIKKLQENGYEAIIVGGWVRDNIIGIQSDDVDIATSAQSHQIKELFQDTCTKIDGVSFHVNIVNGIEVATYRYDVDGDFPLFAECFSEDSARRDLTINSIGYDPIVDKNIDHWNGEEDLKNRIIRFVGIAQARIEEDPVRMLRAARFAAKIDGRLVPSAFFAIKDNAHLIDNIPRERIQKEILKALKTPKPSIFWEILHRTGILNRIIPELDDCWYHDGGRFHSEFVHEHLLDCGDAIDASNPIVRLAGYLHDIGKVEAYDENDFSFIGHEKFGADVVRDILTNLKFPTSTIEKVCALVLTHMRSVELDSTKRTYRRTISKLDNYGVSVSDFLVLKFADRVANRRKENFTQEEINQLIDNFENISGEENAAFSVKDLAVDGNDVLTAGHEKGKRVGLILDHFLKLVLEDPKSNSRSELLELLEDDSYWFNFFRG